ncbi:MAG: Hsp70 family protein, partial [Planctomycetaceae bacterium]|nr:Hsp70 family protein [Planctomycetaceae bacterium]
GLQANGKIAVGWTAKRNQPKFPLNTAVESKRKMARVGDREEPAKIQLGNNSYTPQEIGAFILRRIKELAEMELCEEVTAAVITCPAYFKDPARAATKQAGEIAGLNVLKIINEPTAAAYAYGVRQQQDDQECLYVVYDLGGGTFDVTVIRMSAGAIEVIGTGGDPELGGGNFDDFIVDWILAKLSLSSPAFVASLSDDRRRELKMRLKDYAEKAKIALCNSPSRDPYVFQNPQIGSFEGRPVPFHETITMDDFESMIREKLVDSLKCVDEAMKVPKEKMNYSEKHLTAVLLVGGSTRVPLVRKLLAGRFPETPIWGQERGINPDEIVALGASIVAAETDPLGEVTSPKVLLDVTGHTLSVAVHDVEKDRLVLLPIIPKESAIPCQGSHMFRIKGEGKMMCCIQVYQGEGEEITPRVLKIGEFNIEINPIEASTPLEIGLYLDDNGILIAHAVDKLTGHRVNCKLNYSGSANKRIEELEKKRRQSERDLQGAVIGQVNNTLDGKPAPGPAATTQAEDGGCSEQPQATRQVPAPTVDCVHFSMTSPTTVQRGTTFILDVWAHLEDQRTEVLERAQQAQGGGEVLMQSKGPVSVARGTVLSVRLSIDGLVVLDPEDTILWQGEIGNARFQIRVPQDMVLRECTGMAGIYADGLRIAKLYFVIPVTEQTGPTSGIPLKQERHRRAFASYASEDLDQVLGRLQGMQKTCPTLELFLDVLSLRSGQDWEEVLYREISCSDVFYLFWSNYARDSKWVAREWQCALDRRGIDFIDPVPLVDPKVVPPPPELAAKHFNDWVLAFLKR